MVSVVMPQQHQPSRAPDKNLQLDVKKGRKDVDDQLQTMLNRISFLAAEELKLDREIASTRRKVQEALGRQVQKADQDVASTAQEILSAISAGPRPQSGTDRPPSNVTPLVPTAHRAAGPGRAQSATRGGRLQRSVSLNEDTAHSVHSRTLLHSVTKGAGAGGAATATLRAGGAAADKAAIPSLARPHSTGRRASGSGGQAAAEAPCAALPPRPGRLSSPPLGTASSASAGKVPSRPSSGSSASAAPTAACSVPGSSTGAAPTLSPRAAVASQLQQHDAAVAGKAAAAAVGASGPGRPASPCAHIAPGTGLPQRGMQLLQHGSPEPMAEVGGDVPRCAAAHAGQADDVAGRMYVLSSGMAEEEIAEVLEELRPVGDGEGTAAVAMEGFQRFETQQVSRVVHVKATAARQQQQQQAPRGAAAGRAVGVVGGVGWGLGSQHGGGPGGAGGKLRPAPEQQQQVQQELRKKQQLWKVRRTFGLEPTQLKDTTAQVSVSGAGAWS